jgi:hypothetical protein
MDAVCARPSRSSISIRPATVFGGLFRLSRPMRDSNQWLRRHGSAGCRSLTPLTPLTRMPLAPTSIAPLGRRATTLARPGPAPCVWRCAAVLRSGQNSARAAGVRGRQPRLRCGAADRRARKAAARRAGFTPRGPATWTTRFYARAKLLWHSTTIAGWCLGMVIAPSRADPTRSAGTRH